MSKQLPDGLPPLPEGAVYLGVGEEFKMLSGNRAFDCWVVRDHQWSHQSQCFGNGRYLHYAAPADSEIALLNSHGDNKPSWDTAIAEPAVSATPDLLIPAEVYSDPDTLGCIAQCAYNAGYRIEWDSAGLRGYRDE